MKTNSRYAKNYDFLVHDDLTLVLDERFEECELSKCKTVLAINLCLENSDPSGGTVIVLNHLVDAWAEKERKKQFHPTYDYKNLDYSQFDSIEKEIFTGDFYIFNGQFLHTVTDYKGLKTSNVRGLFCSSKP